MTLHRQRYSAQNRLHLPRKKYKLSILLLLSKGPGL
jgi:hypothetical protein